MRVVGFVAAVAVAAGCGRLGFETVPARDDAEPPPDVPADVLPVTDRHWVNRNLSDPGPLIGARAVFDRARGTVILYGGDHATGLPPTNPSAAMWEYDGTAWALLCDPCGPGPLFTPAMAYDSRRDRIVLFGGMDTTGTGAGLWEWNQTWMPISATLPPPGAGNTSQMAYDEQRQVIVMFSDDTKAVNYGVHVFEYDGAAWTAAAASSPGPVRLLGQGSEATWNAFTGRTEVLEDLGGGGGDSDTIWSWSGAWTLECSTCTGTPRHDASIVFDPSPPRVYEIGGYSSTQASEIAGTWVRDSAGPRMISALPDRRDTVAVSYDARRDVFVLYGGNGRACGGNCSETWELVRD